MFYRALPTKSTCVLKRMELKVGENPNTGLINVLLACSAEGRKLKPFVIGRSANQRCFRRLASTACLPISYSSNKKAWMTAELFQQWLDKLNCKIKRDNPCILLFIDNCTAHPDVQFSNVRLAILPPNTTSKV